MLWHQETVAARDAARCPTCDGQGVVDVYRVVGPHEYRVSVEPCLECVYRHAQEELAAEYRLERWGHVCWAIINTCLSFVIVSEVHPGLAVGIAVTAALWVAYRRHCG